MSTTSTNKFLLHAMYILQHQVPATCTSETYRYSYIDATCIHAPPLAVGKVIQMQLASGKVYYRLL